MSHKILNFLILVFLIFTLSACSPKNNVLVSSSKPDGNFIYLESDEITVAPTAIFLLSPEEEKIQMRKWQQEREYRLKLFAVGDLMCHSTQFKAASTSGEYDFSRMFEGLKPFTSAADWSVGNLETTIRESGFSGYPMFRTPQEYVEALKGAGFNALVLANNHSLDGGASGLSFTQDTVANNSLEYTGTMGADPIIHEQNNISFALLNYTYGTNGILLPYSDAVNILKEEEVKKDVLAMRDEVDFVILFLHWGNEYQKNPTVEQERLAQSLLANGVDLILGSHPHVPEPIREYDNKYVVYSMGNCVSGQNKAYTDLGYGVNITLTKQGKESYIETPTIVPLYRDRNPGNGIFDYRVVSLSHNDKYINSSEKNQMISYEKYLRGLIENIYWEESIK